MRKIIIATRGSPLALAQSQKVAEELRQLHPGRQFVLEIYKTQGDASQAKGIPLPLAGGKGLFTKTLEDALLAGQADLAVHSLKDLPTALPAGLALGGVPRRESPFDAIVTSAGLALDTLPAGAKVGTSSLRRAAQLRRFRPDLQYVPIRGNVDTRLRKLAAGEVAAVIVAAAGLHRLGLADRISHLLPPELCLPAPGQGALGIEVRQGDDAIAEIVAPLNCVVTYRTVTAERAFLGYITGDTQGPAGDRAEAAGDKAQSAFFSPDAGCRVPVAAYAEVENGRITLRGLIASTDGTELIMRTGQKPVDAAQALGTEVAKAVVAGGGAAVLAALRSGAQNTPERVDGNWQI